MLAGIIIALLSILALISILVMLLWRNHDA
jgi:hypothetical protein